MNGSAGFVILFSVVAAIIPGLIASHNDHKHQIAVWVATIAILVHSLLLGFTLASTTNVFGQMQMLDKLWFLSIAWVDALVWACMAIKSDWQPVLGPIQSEKPSYDLAEDPPFVSQSNWRMRRIDAESISARSPARQPREWTMREELRSLFWRR